MYFSHADNLLEKNNYNIRINVGKKLANGLGNFDVYHLPRELKNDLYNQLEKVVYKIEGEKYCKDYIDGSYEGKVITKEEIKSHFEYSKECTFSYDYQWKWFFLHASKEILDEVEKIVANMSIDRERYRKNHFNDYMNYIKQMDDLIDKYNNTLITEWNIDELEKNIYEIVYNVGDYIRFYGGLGYGIGGFDEEETIDNKIIHDFNSRFFNLSFFYGAIYGYKKIEYLMYNANRDIEPYGFKYYEGDSYYFLLMEHLIKEVERKYDVKFPMKYDLPMKSTHGSLYRKIYSIDPDSTEYKDYELFDRTVLFKLNLQMARDYMLLLQDKEALVNVYFKKNREENLNSFIDECVSFTNGSKQMHICDLSYIDEEVSLEEIYYIIKYLLLSNDKFELSGNVDNLYTKSHEKKVIKCNEHSKFLMVHVF